MCVCVCVCVYSVLINKVYLKTSKVNKKVMNTKFSKR